ncbi:MAG: cytidylate kinase-like family protein [Clostridia bacterium]|nr:cytidylate kinase-like family protein [Clostridia bacterium]
MNRIITISREFGSGGREIGKRLADELGFSYYDREIITEVAKETEMAEKYIQNISEKGVSPYSFQFAKSFAVYSNLQKQQTEILVAEQKIIKQIAQKGDCVIVGRGANSILKEYNPMNIFVYANMESKIARCMERANKDENLTEKEIKNKIIQVDKERKKYNNIISSLEWGDKKNYNLCINTSGIDIKTIISPLADYINTWFGGNNK